MKKIPVWKNVILLVSVLVVIIIATFAWFITGQNVSTVNMDVHVGKATYVQVSGDEGNNWSEDLDVDIGVNNNFKEISGNGTSFFAPVYDGVRGSDGVYSTQLVSFEKVADNVKYYEHTFEFRSDTTQDVYLAPESCVTSVGGQGNSYIDGAVRVAFFELDDAGNETLKYIWAPNSNVEYSAETNSFTREGTVEPYYYYQKSVTPVDVSALEASNANAAVISTANTDETGCGYDPANKFLWTSEGNMPADAPAILRLDASNADGHVHKKMVVRVWLEGHDRECVSLLSGQRFTMELQFNAQEVE